MSEGASWHGIAYGLPTGLQLHGLWQQRSPAPEERGVWIAIDQVRKTACARALGVT